MLYFLLTHHLIFSFFYFVYFIIIIIIILFFSFFLFSRLSPLFSFHFFFFPPSFLLRVPFQQHNHSTTHTPNTVGSHFLFHFFIPPHKPSMATPIKKPIATSPLCFHFFFFHSPFLFLFLFLLVSHETHFHTHSRPIIVDELSLAMPSPFSTPFIPPFSHSLSLFYLFYFYLYF